jgi:antitoxin FitA
MDARSYAIIMIAFFKILEETMAQVLVRQLDEKIVDRLKKRAQENGRSLESEVRTILEEAVPDYEGAWKRIEQFHKRLKKSGRTFSDSAELIREDRDR